MDLLSLWSIENLWRGWCHYCHSTSPIWAKLEDNSKVRFNSLLRSGIIQNPSQATWIFLSPEKIRKLAICHIFGVALCCRECLMNERDLFFIIFVLHGLPYFLKNYVCIKKNSKKGQDCLMSVLSCKPVWGIAPGLGYEIPVNFSGHHYCCSKCESEILLYMKRQRKKEKKRNFEQFLFVYENSPGISYLFRAIQILYRWTQLWISKSTKGLLVKGLFFIGKWIFDVAIYPLFFLNKKILNVHLIEIANVESGSGNPPDSGCGKDFFVQWEVSASN